MLWIRISILISLTFLYTPSSIASSEETLINQELCTICESQEAVSENACPECLLGYVADKILSGYASILRLEKTREKDLYEYGHLPNEIRDMDDYKRLREYYYTYEEILQIIGQDSDLKKKYDENLSTFLKLKEGYRPCSNPNCEAFLVRPISGSSICSSCGEVYSRPHLPKKVLYCPYCETPYIHDGGCLTIYCPTCQKTSVAINSESCQWCSIF